MIPLDDLIALVCGDLSGDRLDAVEEHLLACDECCALSDALTAVGEGIDGLVRAGEARAIVTAGTAARIRALGLPHGEYSIAPGGAVACTIAAGDQFNLVTLRADVRAVERLDLVIAPADGAPPERVADVPFGADGTVIVLESGPQLRALPTVRLAVQLIAVDGGGERTVAEYRMDHTAPAGG